MLLVQELNNNGGVLGKKVIPRVANPRGQKNHAELARQLYGET